MPPDPPVPPDSPPELIEFCNTVIRPEFPGISLGECVSFFLTYAKNVPGYIPAHCKEFLFFEPAAFKLEFTNLGKCVMKRTRER
jgi:hypothetical protein